MLIFSCRDFCCWLLVIEQPFFILWKQMCKLVRLLEYAGSELMFNEESAYIFCGKIHESCQLRWEKAKTSNSWLSLSNPLLKVLSFKWFSVLPKKTSTYIWNSLEYTAISVFQICKIRIFDSHQEHISGCFIAYLNNNYSKLKYTKAKCLKCTFFYVKTSITEGKSELTYL